MNTKKEELLGSVSGVFQTEVDVNQLKEPFESDGAVIYGFCQNCGTYHEHSQQNAVLIVRAIGIALPSEPKDYVFIQKTCNVCLSGEREVKIVKISDL